MKKELEEIRKNLAFDLYIAEMLSSYDEIEQKRQALREFDLMCKNEEKKVKEICK